MAVTTEKSTQVTNMEASPPVHLKPSDLRGRVRVARFQFTQGAAAGDATSTADLVKIQGGSQGLTILKSMSRVVCSAFGASRVLDIGHTGYTNQDGTAVAADADILLDGADVSAIANLPLGVGTNALGTDDAFDVDSVGEVTIQAVVAGGTIPAGATLNGEIFYVND